MDQFKLPIAIYARYSSDLQNERSCEDQVIECKQYIERQDDLRGQPTELFTDNAISGSFIINRPSMMRLMDAIKQQKIAAIVSESLDRISRSLSETDEIFRLCTYYGIPIFTVMEGRIQKIHVGLSGTMNSMQIEQISHRVKRGQAGNIRQGKAAGALPYGYKIKYLNDQGVPESGLREIQPEEAKIVQRIYNEFCSGKTVGEIVASLNKEGIPSQRGGKWRSSTVTGHRGRGNGILQNPIYTGQIVWNRHNFDKHPLTGVRHIRQNPKEIWQSGTCEDLRIISDEQWMEAQHLMQKNAASQKSPRTKYEPIGFDIYCSQCGAKTIRSTHIYVICPNHKYTQSCKETRKININKAHRATYEQIVLDPGTRWDEWNAPKLELQKDRQRHIRKAEKERDGYRHRIDRLTDALATGDYKLDSFRKHIMKNESALEDAEKKLVSLEALPALITLNKRKFKALIRAYRNEPEVLVKFLITSVTIEIDIDNKYTARELNPDYQGIAEILRLDEAPKAA